MNHITLIASALCAGLWLMHKARKQQRESGTVQAAKNLRKQGVPVEIAVRLLATRSTGQSAN